MACAGFLQKAGAHVYGDTGCIYVIHKQDISVLWVHSAYVHGCLYTRITGIAAKVAERPSYVNAIGAGASLNYINAFRDSLQDLH